MNQSQPLLTIVVPCYNEEEVLKETISQLTFILDGLRKEELISDASKILFVDDGSRDRTWSLIAMESTNNDYVTGLKLARNVGHQKALLAGLEKAKSKSDCVISIDADLQDDISVIREFILKYHEGYEIVYGVRNSRDTDTFFKRATALGFYRFMNRLDINLVYNHADYRLMSKRVLEELGHYHEANIFLRGIVPLIGFKSTKVMYDRKERFAGETKYPLKKMLSFAWNGVTSFSVTPIRFITFLGFFLFFLSGIAGAYALIQKSFGDTSNGWTSLILSIWFLGGIQLVGIGIIGEYIGKVFMEVKKRPKYAIDIDLYTESLGQLQPLEKELLAEKKFI
ncbi:glycosyltransferase family 2 protein [Priestia megaterium]|nr:glycosyltransferase family 2 protein [Priestia megaterium]